MASVRELISRVEDLLPPEGRLEGIPGFPRRQQILRYLKGRWNALIRRYWWDFLNVDFKVTVSPVAPGNRALVTLPVTLKSVTEVVLEDPSPRRLSEVSLGWLNQYDPNRLNTGLPEVYARVGGYPGDIELYPLPSSPVTLHIYGRALPDFPSSLDEDVPGPLDAALVYGAGADLCRGIAALVSRTNPPVASNLMRQANEYEQLARKSELEAIVLTVERSPLYHHPFWNEVDEL